MMYAAFRYDPETLQFEAMDINHKVVVLGGINVSKGRLLTHKQKLDLIAANGEWLKK